jgi:hypothetical protein
MLLKMAEIELIPVEVAPVFEEPEPSVLPDELIPKRSRGRPPGAKNRVKPAFVEPQTPTNAKQPRKKRPPLQEEEEEEEEEVAPPPKKKPTKRPVPVPLESEEEVEPMSPRAQRRQAHLDAQSRRRTHHSDRVHGFSTLLDQMLAY